jgi:PTH1 family peptidyl-tRNA hydrolase
MVKVVLGIGNPGREYAATRHNVGFRVVDRVAATLGVDVGRKKFRGRLGEAVVGEERVVLVKPETYVNLSGECARAVLDFYKVDPDSLLVVSDDVNLPLGRLRVRSGGSSGGHHGLESIRSMLGTDRFARLRVGIGNEGTRGGNLVPHVLGKYSEDEAAEAESSEERASAAVLDWLRFGLDACMNCHNGPSPKPGTEDGRQLEGEKENP